MHKKIKHFILWPGKWCLRGVSLQGLQPRRGKVRGGGGRWRRARVTPAGRRRKRHSQQRHRRFKGPQRFRCEGWKGYRWIKWNNFNELNSQQTSCQHLMSHPDQLRVWNSWSQPETSDRHQPALWHRNTDGKSMISLLIRFLLIEKCL